MVLSCDGLVFVSSLAAAAAAGGFLCLLSSLSFSRFFRILWLSIVIFRAVKPHSGEGHYPRG